MTSQDPIQARFAELSDGAAQFSAEVAAAYEKFMAAGDTEGWDKYCRDLQTLRDANT